jgi:hypothetical protein
MSVHPDFRDLVERARAQGWRIERLQNSHLRLTPPDPAKRAVVISSTPRGPGGAKRAIAGDLRRSGLVVR